MNIKELTFLFVRMHKQKLICFLLLLLFILAIANEVAIYNIGLITGDYYRILNDKDEAAFVRQTIKSLLLIICISLLKSFKECVTSFLYIEWRNRLTTDLQENYFFNLSYYKLNVHNEEQKQLNHSFVQESQTTSNNDNVDQRVTQDVDKMANSFSTIVPEVIVSPFIVVFYSYKCYSVSGLVGPLGCFIFFLVSTVINKFLIKQVSRFVYDQERREGDFRYQHVRIRSHAESIAFLSGELAEKCKCNQFLSKLIQTQRSLVWRQLFLKCSTNLADYLGSILAFIAISVPLFAGVYNDLTPAQLSKLISENSFFTIYLINCFTRLIDLATVFSTFLGTANRIVDLYKWFIENNGALTLKNQTCDEPNADNEFYRNEVAFSSNENIQEEIYFDCSDLRVKTPDTSQHRTIIKNLTFQIKPHQNLIITGPSGIGKSSLIRVLKHLWPLSDGQIRQTLPSNPNSVIFMPSKPVLLTGCCLAEQIVYPKVYKKEIYETDFYFQEGIIAIMRFLELEQSVLERMHGDIFLELNINWIDHLSAGEVQRLCLARVLYHKPKLVFLDESSTALPVVMERKILKEFAANSITLVSCGHGSELRQLHDVELRLIDSEHYEMIDLQQNNI